jgi:O-antigen/teichoic acid export membrane protein
MRERFSRSEITIINLFTSALAWGWPVLLSLAITPLMVKMLGPDAYGVRGLIISITGYFALLDLGLNGAGTKYLAEYHALNDKQLIKELLGTTLTTYVVAGLFGGGLIWALADFFSKTVFQIPPNLHTQSVWAFRLAGVGFLVSMVTWWGSSIPTGLQRFDIFNGISLGFGTITILSNLAAVWLGYGLVGVVATNVLANVIAVGAYIIAARKLLPAIPIQFSFDRAMFKRTILFGLYMVLFRVFAILFAQLDRTLIGAWLGAAALTFYLVPQSIASIVHEINAKLMQIVFPMASELSAAMEKEKIKRLFLRGANLSVVMGLGVAVPLAALAKPLLQFWMSPEFAHKSMLVMQLLVLTYFLTGLMAMPTGILAGIGSPQQVPVGAIVSGISGLILYAFLIKPFGINGAAFAKLLSSAFMALYYLVACRLLLRVSLTELGIITFRPIGIALVIWLPLFLISPQVSSLGVTLIYAGLSTVVYFIVCWFLGVFEAEEKRSLMKLAGHLIPRFISG